MWSGGVTDTTAVLVVEIEDVAEEIRISEIPDLSSDCSSCVIDKIEHHLNVRKVFVSGLESRTRYYFGVVGKEPIARFKTISYEAHDFTFALGNCADTASDYDIFYELAQKDADFLIHLGDIHYEDIGEANVQARVDGYSKVFSSKSQVR